MFGGVPRQAGRLVGTACQLEPVCSELRCLARVASAVRSRHVERRVRKERCFVHELHQQREGVPQPDLRVPRHTHLVRPDFGLDVAESPLRWDGGVAGGEAVLRRSFSGWRGVAPADYRGASDAYPRLSGHDARWCMQSDRFLPVLVVLGPASLRGLFIRDWSCRWLLLA